MLISKMDPLHASEFRTTSDSSCIFDLLASPIVHVRGGQEGWYRLSPSSASTKWSNGVRLSSCKTHQFGQFTPCRRIYMNALRGTRARRKPS